MHPLSPRKTPICFAVALLAGCLLALCLSGCAGGGGTKYVESVEANASGEFDEVTGTSAVRVGGRIYFRDGRDSKTIKPLGVVEMRGSVLDEDLDLGGFMPVPFMLDVETMDARTEILLVGADGTDLIVPREMEAR